MGLHQAVDRQARQQMENTMMTEESTALVEWPGKAGETGFLRKGESVLTAADGAQSPGPVGGAPP